MAQKSSIVTPQRFAAGFTFSAYLAQVKVNKNRFDDYYASAHLTPEDVAFFRRAAQGEKGAARILALGEDWCPDALRGIPVIVRIAEAAAMELRIFPRDANLDIMNEFLNQGKHQSIPVAVFYTKNMGYICHWIERPALANEERARIEEEVKKGMPGANEQDVRTAVRQRTELRYPAWQQETVREMREMLTKSLGLR